MAGVSGGNLWTGGESRTWSSLFLQSGGVADSQCVSAEMGNFSWGLDVNTNSAAVENGGSSNDLFASLGGGEQLHGDSPTLLDSHAFAESQAWNQTLMRSRGGDMQGSLGNLNEGLFSRQKDLVVGEVPSEWEMRNFGGDGTMKNFNGEDTTFSTTATQNSFNHFSTSAPLSDLGSPILQLPVPQFDMARIKQECSVLDQSGTTLISQGMESDSYRKQDMSGILEPSANRPFFKGMAYDNGQSPFMQGEDQYSPGLWPTTNSFPIPLSGIIPTSSQPLGPLNTNKNSPLWDLIFSKSDIKPHHAIQNFPHFGLENKVQMNRIAQNLTRCHGDDGRECSSENAKRSCNNESSTSDTIFKRPRLDTTNCPMPTFKVRKEKLGDRITALQQLVSPFGKTDTASVLLEAIGYIKFLHDQVQVLSTPYMNNGAANSGQGGEAGWAGGSSCEGNDSDGGKQDLRSRGLCLVPVSATLSVTNDNGADYWSPALGCNYR